MGSEIQVIGFWWPSVMSSTGDMALEATWVPQTGISKFETNSYHLPILRPRAFLNPSVLVWKTVVIIQALERESMSEVSNTGPGTL